MELLINWNSLAGASLINGILKLIDSEIHVLPFLFSYVSFNQLLFPFKKERFFYYWWGGTKSLALRPLLDYCTNPR
jgi:hypothetical protein